MALIFMKNENDFFELLKDTWEGDVIKKVEACYKLIEGHQSEWYKKSGFYCPSGCGSCCQNFEPDLLECEALYMAYWLLVNQTETALKIAEGIFPFENGKACPFYNSSNDYHCSIYNGRPFICRLFGASGNYDKNRQIVWKPCKFYPQNNLESFNPLLTHRQYDLKEIKYIFNAVPPVMSDMIEQAESMTDSSETKLIRHILPETIGRLLMLKQLLSSKEK